MLRFTTQLFGITIFALAMIWFADPGDAAQSSTAVNSESVLWADTTHISLGESGIETITPQKGSRDTYMKRIRALTDAAYRVRKFYMEDVDFEKLVNAGIRGMLEDLDRYSVLMEKKSYDALMESTHGKYSGLGMQIDAREDHIIIVSPIEGTPAYRKGLRAGDVIWEIDGKSTSGMSSSDAAKLMRGIAGTSVVLTIRRAGIADALEFEVERAVISLKSVNYAGVVPGTDIGYVRISRFAEETSHELRQAISDLNDQNVTGLILDLRSNGGGLLDQAKEVSELFLDPGREIVYTKGRDATSERHFTSERPPLFPKEKPMVVLVDEGTASASEIVSGAIQDWDRGIIMGATTYGKGLVQQIYQLSGDGSTALKLTTARYYVPSGRCIQKPERQGKKPVDHSNKDKESDSLKIADREIFYTNAGRIVYGGGGIVPDVEVERDNWKTIEINLERKSMFFDYAIKYVSENPNVTPDLVVSDEMVADFKEFVKEKDFSYKSALQVAYEEMKKVVNEEDELPLFDKSLATLETLVEKEKEKDLDESITYVKKAIKREIVSSIAGEQGVYENIVLLTDKAVVKAVELLTTPKEYGKLMMPPADGDKL